jgi:hypothetical protein
MMKIITKPSFPREREREQSHDPVRMEEFDFRSEVRCAPSPALGRGEARRAVGSGVAINKYHSHENGNLSLSGYMDSYGTWCLD